MNANIERLKLIFIAVFLVAVIGVVVWQVGWAIPAAKCEKEQHKWWDYGQRVCAQPVLISDITGRVITDEKALAEARKALGRPAAPVAAPTAAAKN
ncbi:MAG: hypothetical protein EPO51_26430 [Phenylobacterium sp.]|uniref:hypothetical protein n=1 Tax=Phenylobacterium sp. TaxID=1871053 RepID=UPI0011FF5AD3|nr:hypothetical protein [Phenylobacterium sp.]TAJ68432.1 MAG: hypothetical protein EPO51_26430 [Phenylobacterium sp.]